jgi:hypothetical protein
LLGTPLLYQFTQLVLHQDDNWACDLVSRLSTLVSNRALNIWEVTCGEETAHAVCDILREGKSVSLEDLLADPRARSRSLKTIPLLLLRQTERILLPDKSVILRKDDRILFAGSITAKNSMEWTLQNEHALTYILTGESRPQGWIWRWLRRKEVAR